MEWLLRTALPPSASSKRWTSTTGLAGVEDENAPRQVLPTRGSSGASRGSGSAAPAPVAAIKKANAQAARLFIDVSSEDVIPNPGAVFRRVTMPGSVERDWTA